MTLNRPEARNALSADLIATLRSTMAGLDSDDSVDVVVLTGADPAFCAGLDLKQLGSSGDNLSVGSERSESAPWSPWPQLGKPVIGAVNGVAVTGGLELVINCDIVIASERARFADTHARVGVMPGWGLSVLLPLMVGRGVARRMSLTGDFLTAAQALAVGLVSEVVAHDDLLSTAQGVAASIVGNDQTAVRALLDSYRQIELAQVGDGFDIEARTSSEWLEARFDPALVEERRSAILDRGRTQTSS